MAWNAEFQKPNIYEKFDALRSPGGDDELSFWSVICFGTVGLLILVGFYLLFRGAIARAVERTAERRGHARQKERVISSLEGMEFAVHAGPEWLSEEEFLRGSDIDFSHLDLEAGECLGIFWSQDGFRCGSLGRVESSEAQNLVAKVESELVPRGTPLSIVIPEKQGHVTFCRAVASASGDPYHVHLEFDEDYVTTRMHRRHRLAVSLKVAAARIDTEGAKPAILRVADVALDGLGLLSEEEFEVGTKLHIRMQLPGTIVPLSADAEVAWSRTDVAGLWRSGALVSLESIESRVHLADFIGQAELGEPT